PDETRALIVPALAFQRDLARRNVDDPSQRAALASALYVAAIAGVGDRAAQLAEAAALMDKLPPEMKRLSLYATWRDRIAQAPEHLADILSLRGRLRKDEFHRAPDAADAMQIAERARREYLAAYALHGDPYPGINAATLSMLLGDRDAAQALASEIANRLAAQSKSATC